MSNCITRSFSSSSEPPHIVKPPDLFKRVNPRFAKLLDHDKPSPQTQNTSQSHSHEKPTKRPPIPLQNSRLTQPKPKYPQRPYTQPKAPLPPPKPPPPQQSVAQVVARMMLPTTKLDAALKLFWSVTTNDVDSRRVLYNSIIKKLSQYYKMNQAILLFHEMKAAGVPPDIYTYNTMVSGYCFERNEQRAMAFIQVMRADGISPDAITFSILIDLFYTTKNFKAAIGLLSDMKNFMIRPSTKDYNKIIGIVDINTMLMLYREMIDSNTIPDEITYHRIIDAYVMSGQIDEAHNWLAIMRRVPILPDTLVYNILLKGYVRVGDIEEAEKFFASYKQEYIDYDVYTYNTMIAGYGAANRMDKAWEMFEELKAASISPDVKTFCALISKSDSTGAGIAECERIFNMMEEYKVRPTPVAYKIMISCYKKAKNFDAATNMVALMNACNQNEPSGPDI